MGLSSVSVLRRAQVIKADLIVAPPPGRYRPPWLGITTDWELVRESPIPLLLVKDPHPYRHPAVLAAIDLRARTLQLDKDILRVGRTPTTALQPCTVHAFDLVMAPSPEMVTPGTFEQMRKRRNGAPLNRAPWAARIRVRANTPSAAFRSMPSPKPHARPTAPSS